MTLNEYQNLGKTESYPLIRNEALLLSIVFEDNLVYSLFYLDSFYIEVRYSEQTNKVEAIKAFDDITPLERYINDVNITALIAGVEGVRLA